MNRFVGCTDPPVAETVPLPLVVYRKLVGETTAETVKVPFNALDETPEMITRSFTVSRCAAEVVTVTVVPLLVAVVICACGTVLGLAS